MKIFSRFTVLALMLALFIHAGSKAQVFSDESLKFSQALNWIGKYYVDSVNQSELVETAIREMLQTLDPHSTYLNSKEVKAMSEPLQGNFEGIGISFNILNDTIFVINPVPGGPSEKVGILSGDRIVLIEGKNVAGVGITNSDVFSKLKGDKGTQVTISVHRRRVPDLLKFTITRDKIPINSLDASYMLRDDVGYIKLNRFSFTTMDEFRMAAAELHNEGMKDLILDLSGNGGGYMDVAIKLADQFIGERRLIVYTEGKSHPKRNFYASSRGEFMEGRLVVIIEHDTLVGQAVTHDGLNVLAWSDESFDGTIREFNIGFSMQQATGYQASIAFVLYSITEDYYKYMKSYSRNYTILNEDAILYEGVQVHSNINNGYGILAGFSSDSRSFQYMF